MVLPEEDVVSCRSIDFKSSFGLGPFSFLY